MNYIVFDLEWNQSSHPLAENELLPFEIIEIGAVKLNSKFEIVDSFSELIRPQVYTKLQRRIREMLSYDEQSLKAGRHFDKVCKDFIKWCGDEEDYMFGTWGPLDLFYLQQNMDFFVMDPLRSPLYFYNIQDIFSYYHPDVGNCRLEKAVEKLGIPIEKDKPFHMAIHDAYYTGLVLKKLKPKNLEDMKSVDYYNNPKTEAEEIEVKHKNYCEHVSREFDSKTEAMEDKLLTQINCVRCGKKLHKKIKWFSNNSNSYLCVGKCWYHGYVLGKIKFKTTYDDRVFAIKKTKLIRKSEMEDVKERQETIREKRKEKNKQKH